MVHTSNSIIPCVCVVAWWLLAGVKTASKRIHRTRTPKNMQRAWPKNARAKTSSPTLDDDASFEPRSFVVSHVLLTQQLLRLRVWFMNNIICLQGVLFGRYLYGAINQWPFLIGHKLILMLINGETHILHGKWNKKYTKLWLLQKPNDIVTDRSIIFRNLRITIANAVVGKNDTIYFNY